MLHLRDSLIQRLAVLFRRSDAPAPTTATERPAPVRPTAQARAFQVERDRRAIIEICRRMADEDTRADGVLKALARDATRGGFQVIVSRGSGRGAARSSAADLVERLNLTQAVADWARLTWRDGDSFLEIAVDAEGLIQSVTRKPTLEIGRHSDDTDRFADPTRAYWWADEMLTGPGMLPPANATWFGDWQIIHARWDHDPGQRYGRPLFASARTAWKRMTEGELDIAIRRKTRAGMKFLHQLKGADATALEAYRLTNQDALDNPFAAVADFFANGEATITAIQGDARLAEIADVEHHINTWGIASPVPLFLLGYGQQLNRDVLGQQQAQYERALEGVCAWIDDQILIPLIERQWLLQGIWPGGLAYEIVRPSRQAISPALLEAAGKAAQALRDAGLPDDLVWELVAKLVPGLDVERVREALAAAAAAPQAEGGPIG